MREDYVSALSPVVTSSSPRGVRRLGGSPGRIRVTHGTALHHVGHKSQHGLIGSGPSILTSAGGELEVVSWRLDSVAEEAGVVVEQSRSASCPSSLALARERARIPSLSKSARKGRLAVRA